MKLGFVLILLLFCSSIFAISKVPTEDITVEEEDIHEQPVSEDKMVAVILVMDNGSDDRQILQTIYTSLVSAEKIARVLNIEMVADDEIDTDVFVFNLKSEEQKDITMKMFDEEGYELAANRVLNVTEGNNYNALNVQSLSDGTYKFQITDADGAERTSTVTINRGR